VNLLHLSRGFARTAPLLSLVWGACLQAQTVNVPETAAQAHGIDSQHLTEIPYGPMMPKPLYPSSPRVQKEFVVRYIYNYALSTYTPAVKLPQIPRVQADRSTPEAAMVAMVSAMRSGDYEGWLQCWDEDARKTFEQMAKSGKADAAMFKKGWATAFAGKEIVLVDRVELIADVILDARVQGDGTAQPFPTIFRHVEGKWLATQELSNSGFLGTYQPGLAGVDNRVNPVPLNSLPNPSDPQFSAQAEFIHNHALVPGVARAGK
jgi:hypothetical protein